MEGSERRDDGTNEYLAADPDQMSCKRCLPAWKEHLEADVSFLTYRSYSMHFKTATGDLAVDARMVQLECTPVKAASLCRSQC